MKKQSGITLVALIITIIILIILAVVSVNATRADGLIARANEAKTKYTEAAENENKLLANLLSSIEQVQGSGEGGAEEGADEVYTNITQYANQPNYGGVGFMSITLKQNSSTAIVDGVECTYTVDAANHSFVLNKENQTYNGLYLVAQNGSKFITCIIDNSNDFAVPRCNIFMNGQLPALSWDLDGEYICDGVTISFDSNSRKATYNSKEYDYFSLETGLNLALYTRI